MTEIPVPTQSLHLYIHLAEPGMGVGESYLKVRLIPFMQRQTTCKGGKE